MFRQEFDMFSVIFRPLVFVLHINGHAHLEIRYHQETYLLLLC